MVTKNGTIDAEKLTEFSVRALQKVGVPEEDARVTARILVATDLRGIDSHGVAHLALYVKRIKDGYIKAKPEIEIFSRSQTTAIMDGGRGLGFVAGYRAMTEAIRRAEATGAGFVTVRHSTHYGAGANYAIMALSHNMIGISMTTGGKGMVIPGGKGRGAGINVISMAVPAKDKTPFVLDMATTVVAQGKVEIARRKGMTMPEGWGVDNDGQPVTDPQEFYKKKGALLPLGGTPSLGSYKGFGLSVAVDILCSILSGSMSITHLWDEPSNVGLANHFFGALSIDGFMPVDEFKEGMDGMIKAYQTLPKAAGTDRIYVAGEVEQEIEKQRRKNGIPLHPVVVASLQELAKEVGIEYDL